MALVYADRVKETSTTTGTGTLTLGGAVVGFQAFTDVLADGDTCYYTVTDNTDWEVGLGTFITAGTALARTTILASSNSDAAVSWSAGSKDVYITNPALKIGDRALTTGHLGQFAATTSLQLKGVMSDETGSGALVFGTSPNIITPTGIVKGDVGLDAVDNTTDQSIIETIYPVGAIYISTLATNPNTLLGFGTWVVFGAGRTLVSLDSGDTDWDTSEETGGSKTHTLTENEMPSHRHPVRGDGRSDTVGIRYGSNANSVANMTPASSTPNTATYTGKLYGWYTGGDAAHTIVQPYITVYMWKRTV